jgi:environmental stress-induced protein Ves
MKVTRLEDFPPVQWTGGKTWQVLIEPTGSSLADRNFDYRLSSASIESPHSVFTSYPGFERDLVALTEAIVLHIFGRPQAVRPMQVVHFYGSDSVESEGKTQDLNLIKRAGLPGSLEIIEGFVSGPALVFDPKRMALIELEPGETSSFEKAVRIDIPVN